MIKKEEKPTIKEGAIKKISGKTEEKKEGIKQKKDSKYFEEIGRRKTARARVRLFTRGEKAFLVNNKPYNEYFPILELQKTASAALDKMKLSGKFKIQAIVKGGGVRAQAEAIRHAIAKILVRVNPIFKKPLKKHGYLTRDSRVRERKKFGLKRARRAPQWQKR